MHFATGRIDRTGQRFGKLTVLEYAGWSREQRKAMWLVRCDCGAVTRVRASSLTSGNTESCGCSAVKTRTHGLSGSKEYRAWWNMQVRCYYPSHSSYKNYGGRGITACDTWRESFQAFLDDMGFAPSPEMTLDRINNSENYSPSNCRWASWSEQASNRRPKKMNLKEMSINAANATAAA